MRVGDIATGRAGDKGATLDLTVVAVDAAAYELLAAELTESAVAAALATDVVQRHPLPGLRALKFVAPGMLGGGTWASLRAGMHWQKAAINVLLDLELSGRPVGRPLVCVRPPGWLDADAPDAFSAMRAWATRAQTLGFDGLFLGDRLLDAAVGSEHSRDPVYGASMLEVTTTLAALAAATDRMVLGPLVLVVPYRHPLQLAKAVATLDVISGGRLVLGAGLGWNETEFAALGVDRSRRAARFEESLSLCRRLWAGETVHADGETWAFDDVRLAPLPVQRGGPPVWMASFSPGSALDWSGDVPAGGARAALARVGRLADGWVPLVYSASARRRIDPVVLGRAADRVRDAAVGAGRAPDAVDIVYSDWGYVIEGPADEARCRRALQGFFTGSWREALQTYTIGTVEEVVEQIAAQTAHLDRVDACVLTPLSGDPEQLDALADVRARLVGEPWTSR